MAHFFFEAMSNKKVRGENRCACAMGHTNEDRREMHATLCSVTARTATQETSSFTPILDRVTPVPPLAKSARSSWTDLLIGISILLPLVIGIWFAIRSILLLREAEGLHKLSEIPDGEDSIVSFIRLFVVAPMLALFSVIVVHELGHLGVGLATSSHQLKSNS